MDSPSRAVANDGTDATSYLDKHMGKLNKLTTNPPSVIGLSPRTNNIPTLAQSPNGQSFISFQVQSSAMNDQSRSFI